jgi:YfiH family protein
MAIKHYFFGKECVIDSELQDRSQLELALRSQGFAFDKIVFVKQIHGDKTVVIDNPDKIHLAQDLPKADALVTDIPKLVLAIVTADCAPILLCDEDVGIVGAAHAGWRGARLGVIKSVVNEMKKLGAKNISAMLGPMIHQDSYEVSQEFLDDFLTENIHNQKFFIAANRLNHWLFDLPKYVIEKLQNEDVQKINNIGINTYNTSRHYASYRKNTHQEIKGCGRNISIIMLEAT